MNEPMSDAFSAGSDAYRTPARPSAESPLAVPYEGQTRARLMILSGMSRARLRVDPTARALLTIEHAGTHPPKLRVSGSEIRLAWSSSFGDWLRSVMSGDRGDIEIVLHPAVAWELVVRGGLSSLDGDLSTGVVAGIEVTGGCSSVEIDLPRPAHTVPIRISGGASHLRIRRPEDVTVSVAVSGGISSLRLDDRTFEAIGGSARLETTSQLPGSPRYDVWVTGGASNVEVETSGARG